MTQADPFARTKLHDMFADDNLAQTDSYRPPRVEDRIPRHTNKNDGRPKIWLPDGKSMRYYSRPSSWGKKVEDTTSLHKWETRVVVDGFLSHEAQSETLQIEWSGTGVDDRDKRWELCEQAKGLGEMAARVGTALHAVTERYDLGFDVRPPAKYKADLEEWKRLTRFFEIVTMPSGAPGVECFVAMDQLRPPTMDPREIVLVDGHRYAKMVDYDGSQWWHWVRLAGTFDRLVRYTPCSKCGCRNYILDLKSNQPKDYNEAAYAVQTGIYSRGKEYVPHEDGTGATRYDMPDVCQHKGIIVHLPAGQGAGLVKWVNLAKGFDTAIGLIPQVVGHRREKNWMAQFTPVPDMWAEIDKARSGDEVRSLYAQYPGAFDKNDKLITYAAEVASALDNDGEVI